MHSYGYRANALLTFAVTILACMCALASFSDTFIAPSPTTNVQVSLWDGIIPSKEHAMFWIHTTNKYRLIDQGSILRGKDFYITLHWHIMPRTGKMFADKIVMSGFRLPEAYR